MGASKIFLETISNQGLISAISSTLLIIFVGYLFTSKKILPATTTDVLGQVLLHVSVPALAITAFMRDLNQETLNEGIQLFIYSFILYAALIVITKLFYPVFHKEKQLTLQNMSIFGSTNLFGVPIVNAIFGPAGVIYANVFNIPYRLYMYTYGYSTMTAPENKHTSVFSRIFGSKITIATFIGFTIWLMQNYMPQVMIEGVSYGFLRIDQTATWLYRPLEYLASMTSPLAWLMIGCQLSKIDFKEAFQNPTAWYYLSVKQIIVPLITLLGSIFLNYLNLTNFSSIAISVMVLIMCTPTSGIIASLAVSNNYAPEIASSGTLLTTLSSIIVIPVWMVVLELIETIGII